MAKPLAKLWHGGKRMSESMVLM